MPLSIINHSFTSQNFLRHFNVNLLVKNKYRSHQTLFVEGNPCYGCFFLERGKIKLTKTNEEGRDVLIHLVSDGELLGVYGLLPNEQSYHLTATAIEECEVYFIDRNHIHEVFRRSPDMAFEVLEFVLSQRKKLEQKLASAFLDNVHQRFAHLMAEFVEKFGHWDNGKMKINVRLRRDELAAMIGTSPETLIRLISSLKKEGVLEEKNHLLYITNLEQMRAMAS